MAMTEQEVIAQTLALESREARLTARERAFSQQPAKVDQAQVQALAITATALDAREVEVAHREAEVRAREQSVKTLASEVDARDQIVTTRAASLEAQHQALQHAEHALLEQRTALAVREADVERLAQSVRDTLDAVTIERQRLVADRQAFDADRVDQLAADETFRAAEAQRLQRREEAVEAKERSLEALPSQEQRRVDEANERLSTCAKLEADLKALEKVLRAHQEQQAATANANAEESARLMAWKDALELRQLEVEKAERQLAQAQRKLDLQREAG